MRIYPYFVIVISCIIFSLSTVNPALSVNENESKNNFSDKLFQNLYERAKADDKKALKELIIKASMSADELTPSLLLDLLLRNYDNVIGIINSLDKEKIVKKQISLELLRTGFIDYGIDFDRKFLVDFYNRNRFDYSAEKDFKLIFNEATIGFVRASSCLDWDKYKPFNIFDGDITTTWVEGSIGSGIHDWIIIYPQSYWPEKNFFNAVRITNGYAKSTKLFYANNRAKKLFVEFPDGQTEIIELKDTFQPQIIRFPHKVISYIKFTILEIYKGSQYDDTCISEIELLKSGGGHKINDNV